MAEYTDVSGKTYEVTNTVLLTSEEKEQAENEIVDALYEIFTRK